MSSCFSESEDVAFVDPTPPFADGGGRMGGEAPAGGADDADSEAMVMITSCGGAGCMMLLYASLCLGKTFGRQRGSPLPTQQVNLR